MAKINNQITRHLFHPYVLFVFCINSHLSEKTHDICVLVLVYFTKHNGPQLHLFGCKRQGLILFLQLSSIP